MTVSLDELLFYAGAMVLLFLTPGPVWVALLARAMSGGFQAAWPMAVGVALGDLIWPLIAIFGLSWIVAQVAIFLLVLHWVAAGTFVVMGALLIRAADRVVSTESRLTAPGRWAGFATGIATIVGNPKAILFYIGVLPGFFDLTHATAADAGAIAAISMLIPMVGNLILAASIGRARSLLTRPNTLRRINQIAGGLMMLVGVAIALS